MNVAGDPVLGFLYLCLGAMGIGVLFFAGMFVVGLAHAFAKLVAMHLRGWR